MRSFGQLCPDPRNGIPGHAAAADIALHAAVGFVQMVQQGAHVLRCRLEKGTVNGGAQGLALLVAVLALLFLVFWCGVVANYTGNVWLLLLLIAALTAAWFVSKRMGRFLGKFFMKTGVIDFGHTYVYIYEKSDPKEATVVTYKDIKSYMIVRQGNSLRFLLWGSWVKHPSGYLYVGMTRPFMADTLDALEADLSTTMARHHVKEKK